MAAKRERRRPPPPGEGIPWPTDVVVVSEAPELVVLHRRGVTAKVRPDGTFDVEFDSRALAQDFLSPDPGLTEELRRIHSLAASDQEWAWKLRHWAEPPPAITYREGAIVTEWPGSANRPPRRLAVYGMADESTAWNEPFFKGSNFRFAHFQEIPGGREGAVVQWRGEAGLEPPIAYFGNFSDFMAIQSVDDPEDPEEWREYNDLFENAFMWALEKMGSFDEPGRLAPVAVQAIAEDPEMLLTESISKVLDRLGQYPPQLEEAALEAAAGRGLA